ncbi:MAG: carboxypeptidase regulatory-like domain-containing protein, partial [Coriobacteriia bacterium]|nr:carboxypeptidase regulatory-like domain-containing protein [Coriobacteriia bacterium]
LTDETTGDPVGAIRVSSSVRNGASWDSGPTVYSGEDGVYRIYDLVPGSYRVDFYDLWSWDGFYDYEAWDDHDSWLDADTITFTGTTFVADAELSPGSPDITGRVTDEDTGDPIAGISVTTYYWNITHWEEYQYDSTDENGDYAIYGLPQGMQARIGFKDYGAQNGSYRAEFWDDAATVDTADGLLMEDSFGWPYSGIDAQLTPGDPSIAGTATDAISGDPLEGVTVYLWEFLGIDDPIGEWAIDAMSTYADGTYAFCDLPAGTYWVEFEKPGYAYGRADSVSYPGSGVETVDWAMMPIDADIGGVVRDAVTGHTIAGANLELMWFEGTEFYSVDGATTGGGGGYRFDDVRHGGYKIVAWAFGYEDLETYVEFDGSPVVVNPLLVPVPADAPVRVADRTRFSTAVDIARMAFDDDGDPSNGTQWENVDHVVIASGDDRAAADPLAASGLCGLYDAPLFLVSANDVPAEVEVAVHEIVDQGDAVTVHIVGGTTSVPDARFTELSNAVGGGLIKDRILATGGRYDLAAAIARRMASVSGSDPDTVLVANGADSEKFFDPLALSPISAAQGFPIVLVSRDSIPGATQSVIDDFAPTTVIVGGGPLTVSDSVKTSLGALRWYGTSRYTTAINIANNAIGEGWLSDSAVGVAAKLPDALTGGGVIGRMGGVLLLTKGDTLTPETGAWIQAHKANITNCYVFGGPNSVSTAVVNAIKAKLQ